MSQQRLAMPTPAYIDQQLSNKPKFTPLKRRLMLWLGSAEVLTCGLIVCFQIAQLTMIGDVCSAPGWETPDKIVYVTCGHETIGEGIWCSILPFIAGALGVLASRDTKRTKVCSMMIFSILGTVAMFILILIVIVGYSSWTPKSPTYNRLHLTMVSFAAVNLLLCIFSATLSCMVVTCCQQLPPIFVSYASPSSEETGQNQQSQPQAIILNQLGEAPISPHQVVDITTLQIQSSKADDNSVAKQTYSESDQDRPHLEASLDNDECYADKVQLIAS